MYIHIYICIYVYIYIYIYIYIDFYCKSTDSYQSLKFGLAKGKRDYP